MKPLLYKYVTLFTEYVTSFSHLVNNKIDCTALLAFVGQKIKSLRLS